MVSELFFFRIELSSFDDEKKVLFTVPDIQDNDENGIPVFSEKSLKNHIDYKTFLKDTKTSVVDVKYVLYSTDTAINDINEDVFNELVSSDKVVMTDSNDFSIAEKSSSGSGKSSNQNNLMMYLIIAAAAVVVVILLVLSAFQNDDEDTTSDIVPETSSSTTLEESSSEPSKDIPESSSTTEETSSVESSSSEYIDNPSDIVDQPPQETDNSGYTDTGYSGGYYTSSSDTIQSEYTLSFNTNGGSGELAAIKSAPGQYVVLPLADEAGKSLTRDGYKLIGFSDNPEINYPLYDYKMPTADVVLYAVWDKADYNVKYNSNGGTGQLSSTKVKYGDKIPLPIDIAVFKDGLNLIGWNTDKYASTALKELEMPNEDVTLYAIWSKNKPTATITFHYGDSVMTREEEIGSSLNLRQDFGLKKDGQMISGWYLKDNPEPINYLHISGDCDVYGEWKSATYITITIDQSYLNKTPLIYKVPLDMNGKATLKLPNVNDRSYPSNTVYGCTYGFSTRKSDGGFGTIEYYGNTECAFSQNTTLYRVLNEYGGGNGTEANPYRIDYYDQLLYLAENGASGYFIQTANLKFPDNISRKPINTKKISKGFEDKNEDFFVYDGQGYSIKGLKGDSGLFGEIAAATIKNVVIDGAELTSENRGKIGALVNEVSSYKFTSITDIGDEYASGNTLIYSCRVINSRIFAENADFIGMICGYGGVIENCIVDSNTIYGSGIVGGIVGNACTVKGCISRYTTIEKQTSAAGGIAGAAYGVELHDEGSTIRKVGGEIIGCGTVSFVCTNTNVCGGIVGLTSGISADTYIRSCYVANIYLNGKQNGSISGGDSENPVAHSISYCVADNTNKYTSIGGDNPKSRIVRMLISAPQDGIKVEGILSVLNTTGSGYNQWRINSLLNDGYPYPSGTFSY